MARFTENRWTSAIIPALLIHIPIGTVYCWSVFKQLIADRLNASPASVEWGFSLAIFFLGMSAAFAGPMVEKNIKKSALVSMVCFVVGFAGTGVSIALGFLPGVFICYGAIMGIGLGVGYLTPVKNLMLWFSDNKGLATGIAVVILLVAVVIMMAMVMPKFKAMQKLTDNINLVARENLTGLRVVRAYNAEDYQEAKFTKANKDLTDTQLFTNRVMAFMMPLMNTVLNGLMLAVYWIGAYLIDAAGLTDKLNVFSNMVVFSNYSVQVIMSFLLMSMVFVLWPRADVSAQRVLEVLDTDPIVKTGTKTAADVARLGGGKTGTVEFRNVSFTYPGSREATLEGIDFTAEKGQTVAFIGSTGSGKSSLINLVPRFYDVSAGQVLVDGVDVREYDLKALRDKIGYVPQQSVLFKGTVASNVSYGDDVNGASSADVEMADTSTPAGRKREAELIAAGKRAEGAAMPTEQMNRVKAAAGVAQATEFVERIVNLICCRLLEIIIDVKHVVFVHNLIQEVINIQLSTRINDCLHFIEQFAELNTLGKRNIIQGYFTVDGLNDGYFHLRFIGHRTYPQIFRTFNLVFFTMPLYQLAELFAVTFGFSGAYTGNVLKLLQRHRIDGSHRFERRILKNHIRRHFQFFR